MFNIIKYTDCYMETISELIARFRVELSSLKGINKSPNIPFAREELEDYIKSNFPIYLAKDEDKNVVGYMVLRIDGDVVWVESLYVLPEHRRYGIASLLYEEGERLAEKLGGETLYNWVHPNNDKIINFLSKRGYDVLNLVEIRKPWPGEKCNRKIIVDKHEFNY